MVIKVEKEVVEGFLRPSAIKEAKLESNWSDDQHGWLRDPIHGYVLCTIVDRTDDDLTIELSDHSVRIIAPIPIFA